MTDSLIKAYKLGKRLAFMKYSEIANTSGSGSEITEVEALTKKLETLFNKSEGTSNTREVLDSSERASPATWGDKMELETNSNTGINV